MIEKPRKGDLVRRKSNGELGIVVKRESVFVWLGDGLRMMARDEEFEVVPFSPGAAIPACFVELVDAYDANERFLEEARKGGLEAALLAFRVCDGAMVEGFACKTCVLSRPVHEESEHPTFCELLKDVDEHLRV